MEDMTTHLSLLKDNQCREIIGDARNGICCGKPVKDGSPYCPEHHRKNYVTPTPQPTRAYVGN